MPTEPVEAEILNDLLDSLNNAGSGMLDFEKVHAVGNWLIYPERFHNAQCGSVCRPLVPSDKADVFVQKIRLSDPILHLLMGEEKATRMRIYRSLELDQGACKGQLQRALL